MTGWGLLVGLLLCVSPLWAQESDQSKELADLKVQVQQLLKQTTTQAAQLAALEKRPAGRPEDSAQRAIEGFTTAFQRAKAQAGPGCTAIRGRLSIVVNGNTGDLTITCTEK